MTGWLFLGTAFSLVAVATAFVRAADQELKPGDPAPLFSLQGSDGQTYRLADFRGRQAVVLAWFPKAFTGGCTAECKSLRDSGAEIKSFDVAYFAASVDDAETNRKFAESLELDFAILSDPDKAVARAYGVVAGDRGYASRWTFYIGRDGRILFVDREVTPATAGRDLATRLAALGVPRRR